MRFSPLTKIDDLAGQRIRPQGLSLFMTVLICLAWLFLGLTGHEPWKPGEGRTLVVIQSLLHGNSWMRPMLHGHPYVEHLPLYHLVSEACARLFSSWLSFPDAARLASGVFGGLALWATALATRHTFGRGHGRIGALALAGCLGILIKGHQLVPETALVAAAALVLYGAAQRQALLKGGLIAGAGILMAFFAKDLPEALMLATPLLLLPLVCERGQRRATLTVLLTALTVALLGILTWLWLVHRQHPEILTLWWTHTEARLLLLRPASAIHARPTYFFRLLPWFAWPALPVALWGLWQMQRTGIWPQGARASLLAILCWVPLATLFCLPHEANAMFLLPPFALLACGGAASLRRGAASALDWFGAMTLGLLAGLIWLAWIALVTGHPARMAHRLHELQPDFIATPHWGTILLSVLLTVTWLIILIRSRRTAWRPLANWAVGLTMVWGLIACLAFPYLDSGKSYKPLVAAMMHALPRKHGCMRTVDVYGPQRSMFEYYSGIPQYAGDPPGHPCDLVLVQAMVPHKAHAPGREWKLIWHGARSGDRTESFSLYFKAGSSTRR